MNGYAASKAEEKKIEKNNHELTNKSNAAGGAKKGQTFGQTEDTVSVFS